MVPLKSRPGGINDESRQSEEDEQRLGPPEIDAHRLTKSSLRAGDVGSCHVERLSSFP
jgi:hypothetical protein